MYVYNANRTNVEVTCTVSCAVMCLVKAQHLDKFSQSKQVTMMWQSQEPRSECGTRTRQYGCIAMEDKGQALELVAIVHCVYLAIINLIGYYYLCLQFYWSIL